MAPGARALGLLALTTSAALAHLPHFTIPQLSPDDRSASSGDAAGLGDSSDTSSLVVIYGDGGIPRTQIYEHANALFGIAQYGGGVNGPAYRPTNNTFGCSAFSDPNMRGAIALLDRGSCPFTQKVLNAQLGGAIGAVVIDNAPICPASGRVGSQTCPPNMCGGCASGRERTPCQCFLRYMADDGLGVQINIPSFMMIQYDGMALLGRMTPGARDSTTPFISMQWDIPNADGKVCMICFYL